MAIYESGENYLEAIFVLKRTNGEVRAIDVARHLDYSKPSVSRAIHLLENLNLIVINENGSIDFTEQGYKKAVEIVERHDVITMFLKKLGVNPDVAEQDACRIEHIISEQTFNQMKNFVTQKHIDK